MITWDEILLGIIILVGIIVWCWKATNYHIKNDVDMEKPLWWL